jgi:hypothetical protein
LAQFKNIIMEETFFDEITRRAELFAEDNFCNATDRDKLIIRTAMLIGSSVRLDFGSHRCKHIAFDTPKHFGSAVCQFCKHDLGWFCPDSEDHLCKYDIENDPCEDQCIYCGLPNERK